MLSRFFFPFLLFLSTPFFNFERRKQVRPAGYVYPGQRVPQRVETIVIIPTWTGGGKRFEGGVSLLFSNSFFIFFLSFAPSLQQKTSSLTFFLAFFPRQNRTNKKQYVSEWTNAYNYGKK